jgi:hypothetical protein
MRDAGTDAERNAPSPSHKNGAAALGIGPKGSRKNPARKIEYSPEFERAFSLYPPTPEGHSKSDAYRAWRARIAAGVSPDEMIAGVERYAAYIRPAAGWSR